MANDLFAFAEQPAPFKKPPVSANFNTGIQAQSQNAFQQAQANALPSRQQFDTASNRVSSRVASQQRANQRQAQQGLASSGRVNSGRQDYLTAQNQAGAANATATGIADLESDFWDKQQTGAGILNNVGTGFANLGSAVSGANAAQGKLLLDQYLGQGKLQQDQQKNNQQFLNDAIASLILGGRQYAGNATDTQALNNNYNSRLNEAFNSLYGGLGLTSNFNTIPNQVADYQRPGYVSPAGTTPTMEVGG